MFLQVGQLLASMYTTWLKYDKRKTTKDISHALLDKESGLYGLRKHGCPDYGLWDVELTKRAKPYLEFYRDTEKRHKA